MVLIIYGRLFQAERGNGYYESGVTAFSIPEGCLRTETWMSTNEKISILPWATAARRRICFLRSEGNKETQWPATAKRPWKGAVRSNRPGEPALEQDRAGPSRCGLRTQCTMHLLLLGGLVVVSGSCCIGGDSEVLLGALWASLKAAVTSGG